jgi:hypothetical protein
LLAARGRRQPFDIVFVDRLDIKGAVSLRIGPAVAAIDAEHPLSDLIIAADLAAAEDTAHRRSRREEFEARLHYCVV